MKLYSMILFIIRIYDVNVKEKMSSISVSFISFFIAILCYSLSFYDLLRSPVSYMF